MIGQSERLKHRFNPRFASINRAVEVDGFAIKDDVPTGALFHAGDLTHEGGFTRPVVAHDRHMLPFAEDEVGVVQGLHTAVVLREAFGFQNDIIAHLTALPKLGFSVGTGRGSQPRR